MDIPSTLFERAKLALNCRTNKELAHKLNHAESGVSSWKQRDSIPLEYLMKIVAESGYSLDWIVYGVKSDSEPIASMSVSNNDTLSVPEQMLLTGFRSLDLAKQNLAIQSIFNLSQNLGNDNLSNTRTIHKAKQYNEGDGHIGTINVNKKK